MILPEVAEVIKVARAQAHADAKRRLLEHTMAKLAASDAAGAVADSGRPTGHPGVGEPTAGLEQSRMPDFGRHQHPDPRLDLLAASHRYQELEKEAVFGAARRLAQKLIAGGGAKAGLGRTMLRPVRSPIAGGRLRSPLGKAPAAPKVKVKKDGPFRTNAVPDKAAIRARTREGIESRKAAVPAKRSRPPGLLRSVAGPLVAPGLVLGGLYAGKKGIDAVSQMANRPMPYSFGHDQFMYGYGQGGQASF